MKAHYFLFLSLLPSLSLLVFGAVALLTPQQPSPSSDRRTNDVERSVCVGGSLTKKYIVVGRKYIINRAGR